jgi:hypothetical protein
MRARLLLATLVVSINLLLFAQGIAAQTSPSNNQPAPPPLPAPVERVLYAPLVRSAELPDGELTR